MRTSYFPNSCPVLDPGEYSGFQVTGWSNGGKNQNQKKPCILTGFIKQMQCNELNKFGCFLFAKLRDRDGALPRILRLFWIPNKYLPDFPTQKIPKSKISTPPPPPPPKKKNPSTIPVTWNPEYRLWGSRQYPYPKSNIILSLSDKTYK